MVKTGILGTTGSRSRNADKPQLLPKAFFMRVDHFMTVVGDPVFDHNHVISGV